MRLGPSRFLLVLGAGVGVIATIAWFSAQAAFDLRARADVVLAQEAALEELRRQRDILADRQPSTSALEQAVRAQAAVDMEQAVLDELRIDYQRVALEVMRRTDSPATAPLPEPPDCATPEAALRSVIRAIADGETENLAGLLDFDPSAREQATAFFASLSAELREEYRTAERLVAHVMAAKTDRHAGIAAVNELVFEDTAHASLRVNLERRNGPARAATFRLHRVGDGWRLRVPAKVIEGYRALLTGRWDVQGRDDPQRNAAALTWEPTAAVPIQP